MTANSLSALTKATRAIRDSWIMVAKLATFVMAAVPVMWPPPSTAAATGTSKAVASFVVTAVVALMLFIGKRYSRPRHALRWFGVVGALAALTVLTFVLYERVVAKYTCSFFNGPKIVIGTQLSKRALIYTGDAQFSCSDLLADFAGKAEDIWTPISLRRAGTLLLIMYIVTVTTSAAMFVAVTQLLLISFAGRPHRSRPAA